jgi:cyclopropane fatty-acyl-phospholipid synthase-like methyltransferase
MNVSHVVMRIFYQWRYFRGQTPWDTNITPPELVELIQAEKFPPGRALDLGCGTGTNAIYLAKHGWQTLGIDYVPRAIDAARAKAKAQNVSVEFRAADVLAPGALPAPFDLILDIGCFHALDANGRARYAQNVKAWTQRGSLLLMYAFFPRHFLGRTMGVARAEMDKLWSANFILQKYADDGKSAWYRWQRK